MICFYKKKGETHEHEQNSAPLLQYGVPQGRGPARTTDAKRVNEDQLTQQSARHFIQIFSQLQTVLGNFNLQV